MLKSVVDKITDRCYFISPSNMFFVYSLPLILIDGQIKTDELNSIYSRLNSVIDLITKNMIS